MTEINQNQKTKNPKLLEKALEREKKARKRAEELLEIKSRELFAAKKDLEQRFEDLERHAFETEFFFSISHLGEQKPSFREGLQVFIRAVCKLSRWALGHVLVPSAENRDQLTSSGVWCINAEGDFEQFRQVSESVDFPKGSGLPGKVFETGESHWIEDISSSEIFNRRVFSQDSGISSAFAIPIKVQGKVVAVAEFFAEQISEEDQALIQVVKAGSSQLGTVFEHLRTSAKLEKNYFHLKSTLSELKSAQNQLVQSEKMASLGTISAGVAHEINNPVGFVMSNIGTMKEYSESLKKVFSIYLKLVLAVQKTETVPPELRELVSMALKVTEEEDLNYILKDMDDLIKESLDGSERIREIVAGLKAFSRLDEADVKTANINECIESTLKIVWNELKYKCEIEKQFGEIPDIPCYPGQLNQVFMNLFVNAAHAIKEKGWIRVKTQLEEDEVVIRVSDTGSGISEENIKQLFNPFFTTKPPGKGTGLGLSISFGIIEKHGGSIDVESQLGQGTTFTIRIPTRGVPLRKSA